MDTAELIRLLEERLLHQDFTANPDALEAIFSSDFVEVGPDGMRRDRESVMTWLLQKDPASRWLYIDFNVRQLTTGLVLATYHAERIAPEISASGGSLHCSLWRNTGDEDDNKNWQMIFHQSTPVH